MKTKRVVAPAFFPIPAGTPGEACPYCSTTVYSIETLDPEKRMLVETTVVGGRAPDPAHAGTGVMHLIYCTATTRERKAVREASPL